MSTVKSKNKKKRTAKHIGREPKQPRQQDALNYQTELVKANRQYATKLEKYVAGFIMPVVKDHIAVQKPQEKVLTEAFRLKLLSAAQFAFDMWRLQAHFQNVQIIAQMAIGNPGCLTGPSFGDYFALAPGVLNLTGLQAEIVQGVGKGIDSKFSQWQSQVTVPSLPWYPAFVAYSGPMAPPMPNIPMPLIACVSNQFSALTNYAELQAEIEEQLSASHKKLDQYDNFIYGLCVHFSNFFVTKMLSTSVSMVMGMGPVPSFAPPYVPVGPVVNGWIIPSPGHLAA